MTDHRTWPCSFQHFPPLSFTGPRAMWCVTPLWLSTDEEIASLISRSSFHSGWQVTAWWQLNKPAYRMEHKPHRACGLRLAVSWVRRWCQTLKIYTVIIKIQLVVKAYICLCFYVTLTCTLCSKYSTSQNSFSIPACNFAVRDSLFLCSDGLCHWKMQSRDI